MAGVKEEISGGEITVKSVVLCVVPAKFVTLIFPVAALLGTVARICVFESTVNTAGTPLKVMRLRR
jgi:hypothetical protein